MTAAPPASPREGACFHSARWDHDVELEGRRAGIVGTGSSPVQITSALVYLAISVPESPTSSC